MPDKGKMSGMLRRRLAENSVQLLIGRIALFVFGYPIAIILARELGPAQYGLYGILLSVLVWVEHTGCLGIPEALTKRVAETEDSAQRAAVEDTGQVLLLGLYLGLFIVCWFAAPLVMRLFRIPEATSLFRVAILDIPFSGLYFAYQGILGGRQDFKTLGRELAIYGLTKFIGICVALLLGLSIFSALIVNVLATVGALAYLMPYLFPKIFRVSLDLMRDIVHLALPIGLFLLTSLILFNLDFWCLKIVGAETDEVIGIYAAALNVAKLPDLVSSAIGDVLFAAAAMVLATNDRALGQRYIQDAGRLLWLVLLPSAALFALTAEDLLAFLYAGQYASGASLVALQVFGFALFGMARAFSGVLIAQGTPYLATGLAALAIPVALGLNLVLVPYFGAIGAAASLVCTALFAVTTTGVTLFRRIGPLIRLSTLLKGLVATAVMALITPYIVLTGPWLLLKYTLLMTIYGMMLALLREVDTEDVSALALWRKRPA